MKTERIFSSVNLRLDRDAPERFAHFHPTRKSLNVLQSVFQGSPAEASIIVAAYGSGKSLAAGTAMLLAQNSAAARGPLETIAKRLKPVDAEFSKLMAARVRSRKKGLVFALEGHQARVQDELYRQARAGLPKSRLSAANSGDIVQTLNAIHDNAAKGKYDRITIVWDEFGRHLEELALQGHAEALSSVQQMAEWAVRKTAPQATLCLLLHQNLSNYSDNLSQSARNSWRKIEGRFNSIRYVEDSREIYELIGSVMRERRSKGISAQKSKMLPASAAKALELGMFESFKDDKASLVKLFKDAYPLLPATLHVLPKLASRIAQNERTIFSYLESVDLGEEQSLGSLYRFFSPSMEEDTGVGGTYRRWLETNSALKKASGEKQVAIIQAAALLGMGVSGERARVRKDLLAFAAQGFNASAPAKEIKSLISKKLLLHRKRTDDISVWHGTDVDVRVRLQEQVLKLDKDIDVISVLNAEAPAPYWYPVIHNVKNSIRRFFRGHYVLAHDLLDQKTEHPLLNLKPGVDGRVLYCLANTAKEREATVAFARKSAPKSSGIVIAVPERQPAMADIVKEIEGLRQLLEDQDLLANDDFVQEELLHMLDDAKIDLARKIAQVVLPTGDGISWFVNHQQFDVQSEGGFLQKLSKLADKRFPCTPKIRNEMMVKHQASKPMVNARKKLILGILERSGQHDLGFNSQATTADVALYRTVLVHTGMYRHDRGAGKWSEPAQLKKRDAPLADIWQEFKHFFTNEGEDKKPAELFAGLMASPYGVRFGVLPILFAAGMQAFGTVIAIRRNGVYLGDILASEIEEICADPDSFTLDVFDSSKRRLEYLEDLAVVFGSECKPEGDRLRFFYDAFMAWKEQLPEGVFKVNGKHTAVSQFMRTIRGQDDPAILAFEIFPEIAGCKAPGPKVVEAIRSIRAEVEHIQGSHTRKAIKILSSAFATELGTKGNSLACAKQWASCINGVDVQLLGSIPKAVVQRASEAESGRYTETSFARALSAILIGKNVENWDDASESAFLSKLKEAIAQAEDAAFSSSRPSRSLAPLLERRIKHLLDQFKRVKGDPAALLRSSKVQSRTSASTRTKIPNG